MEPQLTEVFESGSPDDEVGVILRMAAGVEPPPNVRVVAQFDQIFTARVRRGDIVLVRQSPGVISMKASSLVTLPPPVERAAERESQTPDLETDVEDVEDLEALEADVEDREAEVEDLEADEDFVPPVEEIARGFEENVGMEGEVAQAARPTANLPSIPEDGRGVVVGICDWGFDFTHPNFRNADGTTRLLCLWDQRGFGDPLAPVPYNQGRLLTREAINAALVTPDPCATLGYHPASGDPTNTGSHGTHVADILAGNRREPGSEVGLASGADIVFVHLAAPKLGELGNLGDSVGLLEGLDFCRRQAAGRPCVLHLSAGKTGGEKRGQSPLERAVDAMLAKPGIVLVQSVGNYAHTAMHTHARVGPDQKHVLNWIIPGGDPTPNELEIWYSGHDVFDATVLAPEGSEFTVPLDSRKQLGDGLSVWGNFYHRLHEPNSGLNHIVVYLHRGAPSGMWRVMLHGRDIVDGRVHAWIERDASGRFQSRFLQSQASSRFTTNTICNCYRAIAVGAYDGTKRDRPPTRFSSRGPTADGRQKPEIAAPGYMIRAARSLPRNGWKKNESRLCVKSGTSMAAPWVSGTVALMMQAAGRPLTIYEIRRLLIGTADPHPGPKGRSSTRLGYGYLNTAAAVAAARQLRASDRQRAAAPAGEAEQSEETGWASVWVEDAASGGELDVAGVTGPDANDDAAAAGREEPEHECACRGRKDKSAAPDKAEDLEDAGDESDDEAEPIEELESASEQIETPFGWDDVQGALEAFEDHEAPA